MKRLSSDRYQLAFTLPTVVIASIVMIVSLLLSLQLVASSSASLRNIYNDQIAREASEAGVARAYDCLEKNNYIPQWTDARPLRPWTDCTGNPVSCPSGGNCFVLNAANNKTDFTVKSPLGGGGNVVANSTGTTYRVRASDSSTQQTSSYGGVFSAGGSLSVEGVFFGYLNVASDLRPFFLTRTSNGQLKGAGYNGHAQLSTGNLNSITVPVNYSGLPVGDTVDRVFTYFKSGDLSTMVLMNSGRLYVSGDNSEGNLGANPSTNYITTARQYSIGSNVRMAYAAGHKTYVISTSGRLFATGKCAEVGLPSFNDGGGRCWTPRHVEGLPNPSPSNPATRVKQVVADGPHNYLIMEGGQLYGWDSGEGNLCGLLGAGSKTPVRIGNFGDAGQPRVTKIDTDGIGLFALMGDGGPNSGRLYSGGCNHGGHLMSSQTPLRTRYDVVANPRCIDIEGGSSSNTTPVQYWGCTDNVAQHWAFDDEYRIRNDSISSGQSKCLDLRSGNQANGTPIQIYDCQSGNSNQKWVFFDDGTIRLQSNTSKCLSSQVTPLVSGTDIVLWGCDGQEWQIWETLGTPSLRPTVFPSSWKILDMSTDFAAMQALVDTDNDGRGDKVYGAGQNLYGHLGSGAPVGSVQRFSPRMAEFILPNTVRPVSLFHTAHADASANTLVVTERTSDTSIKEVYGAGSNVYGQLGLGFNSAIESTPRKMNVINNAISAKVGGNMSVVLTADGSVYTMGRNHYGQLGDGTTTNSSEPRARKYTNPSKPVFF